MGRRTRHRLLLAALLALAGCGPRPSGHPPLFVEGRAVASAGDTVFGMAAPGGPLLLMAEDGSRDSAGGAILHDPLTVQFLDGNWWVSDLEGGTPSVVRVDPMGGPARIALGTDAVQPHQFAVLPEGSVVFETRDQRLVVHRGDSVATFALVETGDRPSLLVAAAGGVLHAVPGKHLTLYNAFGHVRWRVEWPWAGTAHISAITIDGRARIQILSGVADQGTFIVYTMEPTSGEVTRWSVPDSNATFVVDRLGDVTPDHSGRWTLQ